ncbi:MAG: SseB family protein [Actinomycetota bacterium]|nr:SseB family protein [Actinomycetota bacterium]
MPTWEPTGPFEEQLWAAYLAQNSGACLAMLKTTELALPISAEAAAGTEPPRWATAERDDRSWLMAYTSAESMATGTDGHATHCRITSLLELAAGWPDPQWGLVVNPGLPIQMLLEPSTIARVAAPDMALEQLASPGQTPPLVQKLLPPAEVSGMFARRDNRVSGYVHLLADVKHIGSPNVLLDALGRTQDERELIDDDGSVFLLRWPAIGPELYRSPYGGTTEASRAAMDGWVIEEPPFVGTGFVPNVDQVIREFKVDGIGLPHRAEVVEISIEGSESRRAVWDGDRGTWMLGIPLPPEVDPDGDVT